ncbi:hypothetical protein F5884DRAFT_854887 [Xylogone sp. PMI_703]|nr:hypothetical protein F5884DRAFT_854887 [Xylogone sp. PMI_703]
MATQEPLSEIEEVQGEDPEDLYPNMRAYFGSEAGAYVRGWPSKGGVYIFSAADGVELDFLQLDRFNTTPRSYDPMEEDAHCDRMRKLGATWWRREWDHMKDSLQVPSRSPILIVGWSTGEGVWVLKRTSFEAKTSGVGRIHNALNMEERCHFIERLGGKFYQDPKDCPDLDLED